MKAHFAEVLASEAAALAGVTDGHSLNVWRHCLVEKLMNPHSPYAKAVRQARNISGQPEFLCEWRELIVAVVQRLCPDSATSSGDLVVGGGAGCGIDAHRTAVLILAALHGGGVLSQVSGDPKPLDAALDLALKPLLVASDTDTAKLCGTSWIGHVES